MKKLLGFVFPDNISGKRTAIAFGFAMASAVVATVIGHVGVNATNVTVYVVCVLVSFKFASMINN